MALIRPKLKPYLIHPEGSKFVLEQLGTNRNMIFGSDIRPLIEALDGKATVQQIVGRLRLEGQKITFNNAFKVVDLLTINSFFEPESLGGEGAAPNWFVRVHKKIDSLSFYKTIISSLRLPFHSSIIFYLLCVVILLGFLESFRVPGFYSFAGKVGMNAGSYPMGLWQIFVFSCALFAVKGFLQTLLQLAAQGRAYNFSFRFFRGLVSLGTSDAAIYLSSNARVPICFHLVSILQYAAFTAVVALVKPGLVGLDHLKLACFLLTLMELNPFLLSDFRKLLRFLPTNGVRLYSFVWSIGSSYFAYQVLKIDPHFVLMDLFLAYFLFEVLASLVIYVYYPLSLPFNRWRKMNLIRNKVFEDQKVLLEVLTSNPLFMGLPQEMLDELMTGGKPKKYPKGSLLITQGNKNQDLFVIVLGTVLIRRTDDSGFPTDLAHLGSGATVGESSVIREHFASADVIAENEVVALVISRSLLQRTERDDQDYEIILERIMLGQYIGAAPIFSKLPKEIVRIFFNEGKMEKIPVDTQIIEQGSTTKSFYLLIRGTVVNMVGTKRIMELNQGSFFGEVSLISDEPQIAAVRSLSECIVLRLDPESFWAILSRNTQFSLAVESVANERRENLRKK